MCYYHGERSKSLNKEWDGCRGCTERRQLDIDAFETGKSFRAIDRNSSQGVPQSPKSQDMVISDTFLYWLSLSWPNPSLKWKEPGWRRNCFWTWVFAPWKAPAEREQLAALSGKYSFISILMQSSPGFLPGVSHHHVLSLCWSTIRVSKGSMKPWELDGGCFSPQQ